MSTLDCYKVQDWSQVMAVDRSVVNERVLTVNETCYICMCAIDRINRAAELADDKA